MTDLQKKLLEMLTWLTRFLDENGLRYYAVGGTALGAIRHGGFIPWDDDIDIALPRPDYIKLMQLFKCDHGQYRLETPYDNNPDYLYTYCKFYDKETTLIERQRKNVKRGVYIDVFPLDGVGDTFSESLKYLKKVDKKNMLLMSKVCALRRERAFYKNLAILLMRCIPFTNTKKLSLKIDAMAQQKSYSESLFVANLNGTYRDREIMNKKIFGNPINAKFENICIKCPELYEEFLTNLYGNWRQLPPEDKRGKQHDFVFLDLTKSYLK